MTEKRKKSITRTLRVISFLPVGAERVFTLFALSSFNSQLLCQNRIVEKAKPDFSGDFFSACRS
ncbi:hypothetical protein ACTSEZ_18510 [Metabacillus sp. JX24]|uniref:hypothetical protein n=1 Tax=Metabacillus sp. JX24 TaxID=3240759 RepID=UPI00350FF875